MIIEALIALGYEKSVSVNSKGEINWHGETPPFTLATIQAKADELQEIVDAARPAAELAKKAEDIIYSKYSAKKQAQDQVWMSSYLTQIKASGFDNPELFVVLAITSILGGSTLDSELSTVTDALQVKALTKLVKIGLRITWAEQVIDALKAALEPPEWVVY